MRQIITAGFCALSTLILPEGAVAAQPGQSSPPMHAAAPGQRTLYCPRLLDVTTQEVCDDANARVEGLEVGTGRLAPPDPVFRDSSVTVYFSVARRGVASGPSGRTQVREYEGIRLSRYMSAVLVGEGFRIDPAPPPGGQNGGTPREFGLGDRMMWRWNVTAVDGPRHNLRIEVYNHIPIKNKDGANEMTVTPVLAPDEPVEIPVRRTVSQQFEDAGQWLTRTTAGVRLLTGLLVALGALLTAWLALPGFRRRFGKNQAVTPPA